MIRVLSVVFASVLLSTCGDMSELQEDELREFIRKAKRVVTDELFSEYDEDQIETVENLVVEVLTEDEQEAGEETTSVVSNRCSEVGRKTVFSARSLPFADLEEGLKLNLSAKRDGLECSVEATADKILTTCMKGACSCDSDGEADGSEYHASCVDSAIRGANRETRFTYLENDVANYGADLPDFPNTITADVQDSYRLVVSAAEKELKVFTVSLIGESVEGTKTLNDDKDKSLYVYDSSDQRLMDKLARWPTAVGDDIFDLQINAGKEANFSVFLVEGSRQSVAKIAGYVDEELTATDFGIMAQDRTTTMTSVSRYQRQGGSDLVILEFSADPDPGPLPTGSNAGIDFIAVDDNGIVKTIHGSGAGINAQVTNSSVRISAGSFLCQVGDTVYVRVNKDIYQGSCVQGQ